MLIGPTVWGVFFFWHTCDFIYQCKNEIAWLEVEIIIQIITFNFSLCH